MLIEKYSFGVGDRFGHQGAAQVGALQMAQKTGITVVPVWNKSYREHSIIGTKPEDARLAADNAVKTSGWNQNYYVDADHIGLKTVDLFMQSSNFFTIDVADFIGKPAPDASLQAFVRSMSRFRDGVTIPGLSPLKVTEEAALAAGRKYLTAVKEAGNIYRHIIAAKPKDDIVVEVSFDEAAESQTPLELFLILAALAEEGVPPQTVAPKFTGTFLKGVDYVGKVDLFAQEFDADVRIVQEAARMFNLPKNLKLSIHSGSDKFSLYPVIYRTLKNLDAGLHLKTAGTTWLEELIGLAASGGKGLALAATVYRHAYERREELCKPYEFVINIDPNKLPQPETVSTWSSAEFVAVLRHNRSEARYNPNVRQLLHVGYKVAAEMGATYTDMLMRSSEIIGAHVRENLYLRHIVPLFLGGLSAA